MGTDFNKEIFNYELDWKTKIKLISVDDVFLWIVKDNLDNLISSNIVDVNIKYNDKIGIISTNKRMTNIDYEKILEKDKELTDMYVKNYMYKKIYEYKKYFNDILDNTFLHYPDNKKENIFYRGTYPKNIYYTKYIVKFSDKEKIIYTEQENYLN